MKKHIEKNIVLYCYFHKESMLLFRSYHPQGYEFLTLPNPQEIENNQVLKKALKSKKDYGQFTVIIHKDEADVTVYARIFSIELTKEIPVENGEWYDKSRLEKDERCERDRRFYLRLLEKRPLQLEYEEVQPLDWRKAIITRWTESNT